MKSQFFLPCCYFPTTIICVDDNNAFLSNLVLSLDKKNKYKTFTDPYEALSVLLATQQYPNWLNRCLKTIYPIESEPQDIIEKTNYFDISKLHQTIYDDSRFSGFSIIIVDYDMPGITGVEFCRQLQNPNLKKIMLTGIADYSVAVKAFNEGIIDKFIMKATPDMTQQLNAAIDELHWVYFQNLSKTILKMLPQETSAYLTDSAFITFFMEIFKQTQGSEFYLLDDMGSFLLVDFDGKLSCLIVASDQKIKTYYEIALDHNAPLDLIEDLKLRVRAPFFLTEADRKLPVDQWLSYLHLVKPIPAKKEVYYAVCEETNNYQIYQEKILPYKDFLNKL